MSYRKVKLIYQSEASECALACLCMVANTLGGDHSLRQLRRSLGSSARGTALPSLMRSARSIGLASRPLRLEMSAIDRLEVPCVLHWDMNHYVVLERTTKKGVSILDPARGRLKLPLSEVSKHFTGVAVEFIREFEVGGVSEGKSSAFLDMLNGVGGLRAALLQLMILATGVEVLSLFAPFYSQWVIDKAIPGGDVNLLKVLAISFGMIALFTAFLSLTRGWLITWVSGRVNTTWSTALFSRMIGLPLAFFGKRHAGDLMSRFGSVQTIQKSITASFVEAVLDGIMAVVIIGFLLAYSFKLAIVLFIAVGLYLTLRRATFGFIWDANFQQIDASAKQQTLLMESLRNIQSIKLANKQADRTSYFSSAVTRVVGGDIRIQRIGIIASTGSTCLFALQRVVVTYMAAKMILADDFTVGMLVAFMTYSEQFSTRAAKLIDKVVEVNMLRMHIDRIRDISHEEPEKIGATLIGRDDDYRELSVDNVAFRYDSDQANVLSGLSIEIRRGESVAIVGPSGVGKSTLAKLLVGLILPTEGAVKINGVPIEKYGLDSYRSLCAAVMQDDHLFEGSIADNISFFESDASLPDIIDAARQACIHDDIMMMPMGYESFVHDMGSSFSGGQRQRIILARALYRKPKILVLDEATSHLDVTREAQVNENIKKLDVTRVIIAHRAETISSAERIIALA